MRTTVRAALAALCCAAAALLVTSQAAGAPVAVSLPGTVVQGEAVALSLASAGPIEGAKVTVLWPGAKKPSALRLVDMSEPGRGTILVAMIGVDSLARAGEARVEASWKDSGGPGGASTAIKALSVVAGAFSEEKVEVTDTVEDLRVKPDPKKDAEAEAFVAALARFDLSARYEAGPMVMPVFFNRKSATYGDRRTYLSPHRAPSTGVHQGVDYAGPAGRPVGACGAGLVVLAAFRQVTGNTVIVEHLPGVFSCYYHMESLAVRAGDVVGKGEEIGRVGSTGVSTGPHLHWELRIGSVAVDPEPCLLRPLVDKSAIIATLVP